MLRTKCLSKTSPQDTPSVAGRAWYPFERLRREVDPQHWDLDRFFAAVRSYFPDDPLEAADEEIGEVFRLFEGRSGTSWGACPTTFRRCGRPNRTCSHPALQLKLAAAS
jgi:hypothetical protein